MVPRRTRTEEHVFSIFRIRVSVAQRRILARTIYLKGTIRISFLNSYIKSSIIIL